MASAATVLTSTPSRYTWYPLSPAMSDQLSLTSQRWSLDAVTGAALAIGAHAASASEGSDAELQPGSHPKSTQPSPSLSTPSPHAAVLHSDSPPPGSPPMFTAPSPTAAMLE